MDSETRNLLTAMAFKDSRPFRFSDIFITGILPERLKFVCDPLPFTYHQGSAEQCINKIRQPSLLELSVSTPLLVCSTGRHVAQNTYSDYYRMWTILKYVYSDKLNPKKVTTKKN